MNLRRVLVALIVADVFCAFATMGAEMFFQWSLPDALRVYAGASHGPGVFGSIRMLLWCVSVAATLVAWIALPARRWFGRPLYLLAWTSWILHALFSGAAVQTGPGAMFGMLNGIAGGAILALLYTSDLRRDFERPRAVAPAGVAALV